MPISKYCATQFKPSWVGYLYTLRVPNDGSIFYVGKTTCLKTRLTGHIYEARKGKILSKKSEIINNILAQGQTPVMSVIEKFELRTIYDNTYYDYRELYWIKTYLEYGWDLTNIRIQDIRYSELTYKKIISTAKSGGTLPVSSFYYKNDEKGFPIYDLKKIKELGYCFNEKDFASHWAYIIDVEKYKDIRETTMEYIYSDIQDEPKRNDLL